MSFLFYTRSASAVDQYAADIRLYASFNSGYINETSGQSATVSGAGVSRILAVGPQGDQEYVLNVASNDPSNYITFPAVENITGNQNIPYTFEAWVKKASDGALYTQNNFLTTSTVVIGTDRRINYNIGSSSVSWNYATPSNQWFHFAVVYSPATWQSKIYVNGQQVGLAGGAGTPDSFWRIGGSIPGSSSGFSGQISGLRLTRAARYTTSFTPPRF